MLDFVARGEEEEDCVLVIDDVAVGEGVRVGCRLQYAFVVSVHFST